MRKNTRNLLALLLALIMCLTAFAGCSGEQGSAESTDAATEPSAEVTVPVLETAWADMTNAERYPLESDKTFTVAVRMDDPNNRDTFQLWNELTGVNVDWKGMYGDTLTTAMAGGEIPDAIVLSWGPDKNAIYEYGDAGKLINFMDYLQYMPNFQRMLELHPSSLQNFMNADGTLYSLPAISFTVGTPANLMYVRLDMLEAAGWEDVPATTDEFLQCMLDIQEVYGDVEGFSALNLLSGGEWGSMEWNGFVEQYLFPSFGDLQQSGFTVDAEGNVVLGCTTEQYKRYLDYVNELYTSGACEQDIFIADAATINKAKVTSDLAAFAPDMPVTTDNFQTGTVDIRLLEPLTSEWQTEKVWVVSTAPNFACTCISGELPEEDTILLVKWLDSFYALRDDPLNEEGTAHGISIWLGLEGVNHTLDESNGSYEIVATGDYATGMDWANNEALNASLVTAEWPYITLSETKFTKKQIGVRDYLMPYLNEKINLDSCHMNQDEIDIYNDVATDLNIYMESAVAKFITGEWTVEENWDQYLNELESLGIYDLVEAYQAAYDRTNG